MNRRRLLGAVGLALALVGAAAACGGDDDSASSVGDAVPAAEPADEAMAGDDAGEGGDIATGGSATGDFVDLDPSQRQIITTGWVTVHVDDVEEAAAAVIELVESVDGFVAEEETSLGDEPFATFTLRLPPGDLRAVLSDLGELGEISNQQIATDDVTAAVVDLDSRERTLAASVERLREFLDDADTVTDIAQLESELVRREADLESIRGQLRSLENQVARSTLTVVLTADAPPDDDPTFVDAVKGGWDALAATGNALALAFGAIVVWLPVLAVVVGAGWLVRRRNLTGSFRGRRDHHEV